MVIDCHVHVSAFTPPRGAMSAKLLRGIPFRFMRWHFGLVGSDASTDLALETLLVDTVRRTPKLDAAVVLAFDAVYDRGGARVDADTNLYVGNDYVIDLAARHRRLLFGASVHPYRKDAVAEIERCVKAGAVLMKWLPNVQGLDPADERCAPFYEALAHFKLPLLSHTGGEASLPELDPALGDPALLLPALRRGVTVIAAHCGTRSSPRGVDWLPTFARMAKDHERCYGDTAALNLPTRWYGFKTILGDPAVRAKLVHGSDWPILSIPPPKLGWRDWRELMDQPNWLRRDAEAKERLGFDDAYWLRAGEVLRLQGSKSRDEKESFATDENRRT